MADQNQPVSGARPGGGPDADDPAYKALESQRRSVEGQSDAAPDASPTAADANQAFQESRGGHEPRERPTERS